MSEEADWARWASGAVRAARMAVEHEGAEPNLTLDDLEAVLRGFAAVHAEAIQELREEIENLKTALISRASIEQAKGLLVAQSHVTPDQAFELLVRASQRENVKLRDIAARMMANAAKPPSQSSRAPQR
jgi:AmiR/NasT family two-component response regulator